MQIETWPKNRKCAYNRKDMEFKLGRVMEDIMNHYHQLYGEFSKFGVGKFDRFALKQIVCLATRLELTCMVFGLWFSWSVAAAATDAVLLPLWVGATPARWKNLFMQISMNSTFQLHLNQKCSTRCA